MLKRARGRLIPAYAGSTMGGFLAVRCIRAHPRLRGEHKILTFPEIWDTGSSPLTRGAPSMSGCTSIMSGLIPAYAGSTSPRAGVDAERRAHPRLRGEHST